MKKNKLLYIILTIVLLFSFNNEVDALLCETNATVSMQCNPIEGSESKSCAQLVSEGVLDYNNANLLIDNASDYDANCIYIQKGQDDKCTVFQFAFNKTGEYLYAANIPLLVPNWVKNIMGCSQHGVTLMWDNGDGPLANLKDYFFGDHEYGAEDVRMAEGVCPIAVSHVDNYSKGIIEAGVSGGSDFIMGFPDSLSFWDGTRIVHIYDEIRIGGEQNMTLKYSNDVEVTVDPLIERGVDNGLKNSTCEEILGESGVKLLSTIVTIVKIAIPLILIGLGVVDFAQAIFAGDEDKMKKSQKKFINRLIIGVGVFLTPTILGFILKIAHSIWPVVSDNLCGIKF